MDYRAARSKETIASAESGRSDAHATRVLLGSRTGSPLRVGLDARYAFRRRRRGIGEYVASLLRHLPEVAGGADEFFLYVDRSAELEALPLSNPPFNVRRLRVANPLLWEEVALPLAAARDRLDLLHLTSNYGPSWAPCPKIYTILDLIEFIRPMLGPMRLPVRHRVGRAVRTRTLPRQVRRACGIITVSEASREDLMRLFDLPKDRISVVPLGVSPDLVPAKDSTAVWNHLRRSGYAIPNRYVLALGALDPRKNGLFLMRSFARVHEKIPDAHLVIVGVENPASYPIPFRDPPRWLSIYGFAERKDLIALIQAATIFVYPSLYEGFGLPVLEAMSCGVPILAADRASIPEVVGKAGMLFDPLDEDDLTQKLILLLSHDALRQAHARAGIDHARHFSWLDTALRTYALYGDVLGESSRGSSSR